MPDLFCFTASLGVILSLAVSCILYVYGRLFCMFQSRCRAIGTGSKASQNSCKAQFSSTFQYDWLFFVHLYQYVIFSSWTKDPRFRLLRAKLQLTLAALSELHLDAFNIFRTWTWVMLVMFISWFYRASKNNMLILLATARIGWIGWGLWNGCVSCSCGLCSGLLQTQDDWGWLGINLDMSWHSSYFFIFLHFGRVDEACCPASVLAQSSCVTELFTDSWRLMTCLWRLMKAS